MKVDTVIVGAGSAGLSALREVRRYTDDFLLVNAGDWGTTCAAVGCMPSKALIEAANAYHRRHAFPAFAIAGSDQLSIDIPAVLGRVRSLRDRFVGGVLKTTENLGERNIAGKACLLGPNRVDVNGQTYEARRIIIATGSHPIVPAAWQDFSERILTTDNLFEQQDLPQRIAVIGLGVIGIEIAQALARLGLDITGFGTDAHLAGISDPTVNDRFAALLHQEMTFHTRAEARVSATAGGLHVSAPDQEIEVDAVLAAMGRRPNIDGLGLDKLGVELDQQGLPPVDPTTMRIADLPVFFVGDVNSQVPLLHEAADEGHIAGRNATAHSCHCYQRRTPLSVVFSDPNVAIIGKPLNELDSGETLIGQVDFSNQGRARTAEKNHGLLRIYTEKQSGKLLGAEMCAPAGEHMAHLLALAIQQQMTVRQLLGLPFYHPVLEEGLRSALRDLASQLPEDHETDLATCGSFDCEALD